MPAGGLTLHAFDAPTIFTLLASNGTAARYLHAYLEYLGAQTVIVEEHYVDRHYLDDFARYYSRSFSPPPAFCKRLHFVALPKADVEARLARACTNTAARDQVEQELLAPTGPHGVQPYLGFVVRRPLGDAAIGRTVLQTYPADGGRRHIDVVREYRVQVAGLSLKVMGLAYQQQDRGAAVCASTALWSALQRVARIAGHRSPTPSEITAAAESPFPAASGLNDAQMARAIAQLGYGADTFAPVDGLAMFRAKVVSSLESQLPVLLLITSSAGAHAVCVTGFSVPTGTVAVPTPGGPPVTMRASAADVLYVHDDNLGSHAHYELFDKATSSGTTLMLRRGRSNQTAVAWWTVDEWKIVAALIPKPEKIRLSFDSLFTMLVECRTIIETLVLKGIPLKYGVKFVSGSEYKRKLIKRGFAPASLQQFHWSTSLPRHAGVVSAFDLSSSKRVLDVVLDASEVERIHRFPTVLALVAPGVPEKSIEGGLVTDLAKKLDSLYAKTVAGMAIPSPIPVLLAP